MRACGVDGCKSGWFFFELDDNEYRYGVFSNFGELISKVPSSKNIFVDIPIGLPAANKPLRSCDVEARKMLGSRRSCVFPAPIREVANSHKYEEANLLSKQLTGKGLSKQTYFILPKINDVDRVLLSGCHSDKNIREAHPELCFLSLSDGKPMKFNKKTNEGFIERLNVLKIHWNMSEDIIMKAISEFRNPRVAKDDIVDALVLAIVAYHPEDELISIPEETQPDKFGLPMEMVFSSYFLKRNLAL